MKTITVTLAALLISAVAGAHDATNTQTNSKSTPASVQSGSSTANMGHGMTMNDNDKMYEACRSIRTDKSCDEIMKECAGQADRMTCVHGYMRK